MAEASQEHDHTGAFAGMHSHAGGPLHWHDEFGEHTSEALTEEELVARKLDWQKHNVAVVTVGIDIGSSTSHLMFSRIFMQLLGEGRAVHSVVVGREILWQSPIILTPYLDDDTIDAEALRRFVAEAYTNVGATAADVDTGAVILTGEALKRKNARAIAELFALETGKFVCAAAGHHLEAVLAANGSGTVARSRRDQRTLLNVDIGGGTTKFALVRDGEILGTAAVAVGARQLVKDAAGNLSRVDEPARQIASQLGIELVLGAPLAAEDEAKIVAAWTDVLTDIIERRPPSPLTQALMLTDPLPADVEPQAVTFSGGVSEYLFFRETADFGDLGAPLAKALRNALASGTITLPAIIDPNLGIRATAIGASLFTTQVGINPYITDEAILPLRNVPVLVPRLDLESEHDATQVAAAIGAAATRADFEEGETPVALACAWPDEGLPERVRVLAEGVVAGLAKTVAAKVPFVLLVEQTVAQALGASLRELGVAGDFVVLESVSVTEFDFIELAPVIHPTEVVPLTVKSLLFAGGLDRRSVKQALLAAAMASR